MAGSAAIKNLGKKKIFFLARADSWGWDMRDGAYAAAKENGATIVGYDEVSLGTNDFTTILQKVKAAKPDVFISAQFAADAVALLKQCHQMGLNKEMTIFNSFITNVVAKGLPPEALQGVYSMHYFYYDLAGFEDKEVAASAKEFTDLYRAKYNKPPDAYATIAYVAYSGDVPRVRSGQDLRSAQGLRGPDGQQGRIQIGQGPRPLARGPFGRVQVRRLPGQGKRSRGTEERMGSFQSGRLPGR